MTKVQTTICENYDTDKVRKAVTRVLDAFGGIEEIVQRGENVLLKPNLLSPRHPDEAVTTHPAIIRVMVDKCFQAGAANVWVGDSCASDHDERNLWDATGMTEAVAGTEAELRSFVENTAPCQCGSMQVPAPDWYDEVDCFISLPKMKSHALTGITCSIKNSYGLVCGQAKSWYHSRFPSPRSMSRFLVDVYEAFQPRFILTDAILAMDGEGPASGSSRETQLLLGSTDGVLLDAVVAQCYGYNPRHIPTIHYALEKQLTPANLKDIEINGEGRQLIERLKLKGSMLSFLRVVPEPIFRILSPLLKYRPEIVSEKCRVCGVCQRICSKNAIGYDEERQTYVIHPESCIVCLCCMEACPYRAIRVRSITSFFSRLNKLLRRKK